MKRHSSSRFEIGLLRQQVNLDVSICGVAGTEVSADDSSGSSGAGQYCCLAAGRETATTF